MKRILSAAICVAAAIAMVQPASAHGDLKRSVVGTILLPAPWDPAGTGEVAAPGVTRHARCAYTLARDAGTQGSDTNGVFGWVVEFDELEGDGEHTFTLSADEGDIAVIFSSGLKSCQENATETGRAVTEGDEEGDIPFDTTHAVIVFNGAVTDIGFTMNIYKPEEEPA